MKRILYTFGAFAVAALALYACQKQEISLPESNMVTVTLTAEKAGIDTKTAAVEGESVVSYVWTEEDKTNMKLFVVGEDSDGKETLTEVENPTINISSDSKTLTITATVDASSTLRAMMSSAWTSGKKPKVNPSQSPAVDNFDPNADILVADDVTVDGLDNALLTFRRPVTVSKMTLKNMAEGEKVREITVSSDKLLVGYYSGSKMDGQTGGNTITLTFDNVAVGSSTEFPVYFVTMPNEGHTLSIVVKTDQNTYAKEFGTLSFSVGKFSKFGVDLSGYGTAVEETDYTGDWVITGDNSGSVFAAQAYSSGNNNLKALGVELDVEKKEISSAKVNDIKMHFEKISEGTYEGLYTIKDNSGNYLYAASSEKNYLLGSEAIDTEAEANYYWSVDKEPSGVYTIKASKSSYTRNIMRFNSGSSCFACYASGQNDITIYPWSWVVQAKEYNITVSTSQNGTVTASAEKAVKGTEITLTVTPADNYELESLTVVDASGTAVSVSDNTFTMPESDVTVSATFKEKSITSSTTATISFGSADGSTAINSTSVTGSDSASNDWEITTVTTSESFTQNASYSQVGSSKKPATSITFTTTLPKDDAVITSFSAKFGGFSGTAGDITLKVDDKSVGTGSLDATNDVTVSNTSSATGNVLTVTVTNIAKGVKVYNISVTYE